MLNPSDRTIWFGEQLTRELDRAISRIGDPVKTRRPTAPWLATPPNYDLKHAQDQVDRWQALLAKAEAESCNRVDMGWLPAGIDCPCGHTYAMHSDTQCDLCQSRQ